MLILGVTNCVVRRHDDIGAARNEEFLTNEHFVVCFRDAQQRAREDGAGKLQRLAVLEGNVSRLQDFTIHLHATALHIVTSVP